jgi:hypothetical protein
MNFEYFFRVSIDISVDEFGNKYDEDDDDYSPLEDLLLNEDSGDLNITMNV